MPAFSICHHQSAERKCCTQKVHAAPVLQAAACMSSAAPLMHDACSTHGLKLKLLKQHARLGMMAADGSLAANITGGQHLWGQTGQAGPACPWWGSLGGDPSSCRGLEALPQYPVGSRRAHACHLWFLMAMDSCNQLKSLTQCAIPASICISLTGALDM